MTDYDLVALFEQLLKLPAESEVVEFKEAKNNFDSDKLGQYFSALSNEANLKQMDAAWLVFGLTDKQQVVGTAFRPDQTKLNSLIREIADQTSNRFSF